MNESVLEMLSKELASETTEVTEQEVVEVAATEEVAAVEQVVVDATPEAVVEQVAATEEEVVKPPKSNKIEVDTKDWLESNEDKLFKYLKEKKTDYTTFKPEELVALKFKQDNPELSDEDIKEELADKYGIGLEKITIDDDLMTDEEIADAKIHNKSVDKLQRQLKKDAPQAEEYFKQIKESLEVPKFEFELPKSEEPVLSTEELFNKYQEDIIQQSQDIKEKQWTPTVKENVQRIESVNKKIEVEIEGENVILEVNYKPSEADKKQLEDFMIGYVASDYDNTNYVNEQGVADMERFFQDKAKDLLGDKIMKSAIVDALAKQKAIIYKKQINYSEPIKSTTPLDTPNTETELMNLIRSRKQN